MRANNIPKPAPRMRDQIAVSHRDGATTLKPWGNGLYEPRSEAQIERDAIGASAAVLEHGIDALAEFWAVTPETVAQRIAKLVGVHVRAVRRWQVVGISDPEMRGRVLNLINKSLKEDDDGYEE